MASYSIVLAPMASIMIADYYIVKSRKMDVTALYDPHGRYRFSNGWNWRAFVALIVAIGPNLPGMINAIQPSISIGNIRYIYMISNIWGIVSE
jgi:NCS1 family nucleobase:cation symporter-1